MGGNYIFFLKFTKVHVKQINHIKNLFSKHIRVIYVHHMCPGLRASMERPSVCPGVAEQRREGRVKGIERINIGFIRKNEQLQQLSLHS